MAPPKTRCRFEDSDLLLRSISFSERGVPLESSAGSASFSLFRDHVVIRLASYYLVVFLLFLGLGALFPSIIEYMDLERLRVVTSAQDLFGAGGAEAGAARDRFYSTEALFRLERTVPVLVSMFGALTLALPVAWVYTWTGSNHKSRQGVARALMVLPIAIAFVVFLVKGSLPLAFSLAGIVAAVRFRTSLSDTTDAVFLFVVIGIGLAAGVQLLSVAFLASVLFTAVTLAVWGTRFAENPPQLVGVRLIRADPAPRGAFPGEGTLGVGERVGAESTETVFSIHSTHPEQAERLADLVFSRYAKEWRLDRVVEGEGEGGSSVLEFSVRLKKRTVPATVVSVIREMGGSSIEAVESASG